MNMENKRIFLAAGAFLGAAIGVFMLRQRQAHSAKSAAAESASLKPRRRKAGKRFRAFLSHFKQEAGTEARLLQQNMEQMLQQQGGELANVFLDSDDLKDLRLLLDHVKESEVLVLLQTTNVLTRPYVILELHTAITNNIPIVAVHIHNSWPYDYGVASDFCANFDNEIEIANPGAAALLLEHGVDPEDVAYRLSTVLPSIVSVDFRPNESINAIRASLEDLVDSMSRAEPLPITISRDQWRAKRNEYHARYRKPHGREERQRNNHSDSYSHSSATVPPTCPELPRGFLVRDSDTQELKEAVLGKGNNSPTALTSEKSGHNKIGAHGMGGIGKTTLAIHLVHDEEVLSSFETVVWISVGVAPDIRELQSSIHFQICGKHFPETVMRNDEAVKALRDVAKRASILLVLDDIWDQSHEKMLNCIDPSTKSRLVVTTRIRGLLQNCAEVSVGVLSRREGLNLLLASADMDPASVADGSDEHRVALEIVELCGRLPLTLSIAGGMVADSLDGLTDEIVDLIKEDRLREQDDENESGITLEGRIIASSLKMIGKNKELTEAVFLFFAVFPEDIPVPAGFFNAVAPILTNEPNEKKAKILVGNALRILLRYNLLKGSLSSGHGVFMHDLVRDYVIDQRPKKELAELQKCVVNTVLRARPPTGFVDREFTPAGTFIGYVSRQMFWHISGALTEGEEPPDAWLAHSDDAIKASVAEALGLDAMVALSESREKRGELVRAAQTLLAARLLRGISWEVFNDLVYRATDLLESADDKDAIPFEVLALKKAGDYGSARHMKASRRMKQLLLGFSKQDDEKRGSVDQEDMPAQDPLVAQLLGLATHVSYLQWVKEARTGNLEKILEALRELTKYFVDIRHVQADNFLRSALNFHENLASAYLFGIIPVCSHLEKWNPSAFGCSEEALVHGIEFYEHQVCGPYFKRPSGPKIDYFLVGSHNTCLALLYGNLAALNLWYQKTVAAFRDIDLISSYDYKNNRRETLYTVENTLPLFHLLGLDTTALFEAIGFTLTKDGLKRIEAMADDPESLDRSDNSNRCYCRIATFLASPKGAVHEIDINQWMPSPTSLAELERTDKTPCSLRWLALKDLVSFGARAFLKLGRDDEALELARIGVSPEQKTLKKTTLVNCHSILGQISAKRGDVEAANGHFANALAEAKLSRLPMMEVLAARDWKNSCSSSPELADAAIDGACKKMNKTRAQLAPVLFATGAAGISAGAFA